LAPIFGDKMRPSAKLLKDFFVQETPSGVINGINQNFSISYAQDENHAVMFFMNGLLLKQGTDYNISGTTLTTTFFVPVAAILSVFYVRKEGE